MPFYPIKTTSSNSQKIEIFPKGLTHGFSPNMVIFTSFFFLSNIGQENVFYDILERKNACLAFFLGSIGQENVFNDILE